ncbi:MAG TPA: N-acetylmuramoyl-L-alanine amidase [Clostridiaceae bacterium]|nr:N-acetylmuramoyl-L-alanine amidase [Clostridiaceae bacterium]
MHESNNKHLSFVKQAKRILANKKRRKFFIRRITILACLVLVLSSALYMLFRSQPSNPEPVKDSKDITNEKSNRSITRIMPETKDNDIKTYLNDKPVVIDAGHGGIDPGSNNGDLVEKDINLDVALKIGKLLEQEGIKTILTRNDDTFMKPSEKIGFANENDACLFVSIHCNYFDDTSVNGTTTYYYPSDYKDAGNLPGKEFATMIQEALMNHIGTRDRGIAPGPKTIVLKNSKMPSALVELAFITNPSDAALLASENFRQKAAEGIAQGIKKAVEILYSKADTGSADTGTSSENNTIPQP